MAVGETLVVSLGLGVDGLGGVVYLLVQRDGFGSEIEIQEEAGRG